MVKQVQSGRPSEIRRRTTNKPGNLWTIRLNARLASRGVTKRVKVRVTIAATYDQSTNSVTLTVMGKPTFAKGGQITLMASAPHGVSSTAGVLLDTSDTVFTILPKAKGITPA